jgi:hypothetical protein
MQQYKKQRDLIENLLFKEKLHKLTTADILNAEKLLYDNDVFQNRKWIIFNPNTKFVYVYENRQILPKMKDNCYLVIE